MTNDRFGFQQNLWKTLLKTFLFKAQTFEIRGLLPLCTYFVQTWYAPARSNINSLTGASLHFLGVFAVFI